MPIRPRPAAFNAVGELALFVACTASPRRASAWAGQFHTALEVSLFFLLKLLFLRIWLPIKIIGELIEHSGRGHRSRRNYGGAQSRNKGNGCLAVVLVVVVLAAIGAIAASCGGAAQPAGHKASAGPEPVYSISVWPSPSASTAAHHARHHSRRRHRHHHAAAVPKATQSAPPATSCYPLSNEGTCYEPGEFCRYSDEGRTGVAGDGEKIKCEDNNGWRWEPV